MDIPKQEEPLTIENLTERINQFDPSETRGQMAILHRIITDFTSIVASLIIANNTWTTISPYQAQLIAKKSVDIIMNSSNAEILETLIENESDESFKVLIRVLMGKVWEIEAILTRSVQHLEFIEN